MAIFQVSNQAAKDLDEIALFTVTRWGEEQAEHYLSSLESLFLLLAAHPKIGRRMERVRPGLFRFEHRSHVVLYGRTDHGVRVERVLHKSRIIRRDVIHPGDTGE